MLNRIVFLSFLNIALGYLFEPLARAQPDLSDPHDLIKQRASGDLAPINLDPDLTEKLISEGEKYETGGKPEDYAAAAAAYLKALEAGNSRGGLGLYLLAERYQTGRGLPKDGAKARSLFQAYRKVFEDSAHSSDSVALLVMGMSYDYGVGTAVDLKKAAILFLKALGLVKDDPQQNAEAAIAAKYLVSVGIRLRYKQPAEANLIVQVLSAAADYEEDAGVFLARLYSLGEVVRRNPIKAAELYRKAAERGNSDAQEELGMIYRIGEGVIRDDVEALKWLTLAAVGGDSEKVSRRDQLEAELTRAEIDKARELARRFSPRDENVPIAKEASKRPRKGPTFSATGFFISNDGYLLTNHHVVRDSRKILVHTDSADLSAKLIRTDVANDLALLKVDGLFSAIPLGNVLDVALGDSVTTIGFPNIQVQGVSAKFTAGEISSLSGIQDDPRVFQISVPIQPGNSGGALVDERGNVVGITSAGLSATAMLKAGGSIPQNVNYAVKISYAQLLLDGVPDLSAKLLTPGAQKLERSAIVDRTRRATVLILVWQKEDQ